MHITYIYIIPLYKIIISSNYKYQNNFKSTYIEQRSIKVEIIRLYFIYCYFTIVIVYRGDVYVHYKIAEEILYKLGINKSYRGFSYIVSSIDFIYNNEYSFTPITKVLYVEIAKQYNTSNACVEKSIRDVIKTIWDKKADNKLIYEIFGNHILLKRPSNMEFLMSLYQYIKNYVDHKYIIDKNNLLFQCPLSGRQCDLFYNFIINMLDENH